jgi:hypothetical protein
LEKFPSVRASAVRDTLDFLDKFEPGARARVLERVPAVSRDVIESTAGFSWISIEHDHWTIDAMIEIFGRERAIACWRDSVSNLLGRPFLRDFVIQMLKVIGRSPVSVVRLFAKGWSLVYRDLCDPVLIATADGQPAIRFENIAPAIQQYGNYLYSWHGACQGFAQIARVHGSVSFETAPDLTWAEAKFFWEEKEATGPRVSPR